MNATSTVASSPPEAPPAAAPAHAPGPLTRPDAWSLILLGLFTAVVLAGFGSFGRHPELLARFPSSREFYPVAFEVFARGHVILAFLVLALILGQRVGLRWLPALVVAGAISLGVELLGTSTGFPFSGYRYTELLGWQVAGLVPLLIPLSWFMMAFPAYVLARALTGARSQATPRRRMQAIVLGAALLTAWDLTLDPAMSDLAPYWLWDNEGIYYGMPLVNLLGWFATGLIIMTAFEGIRADRIADRIPPSVMEIYYATVLALSLAMTLIAGYWLAVGLTLVVLILIRRGGLRWAAQ